MSVTIKRTCKPQKPWGYLGVDPSTKTGLVILGVGGHVIECVNLKQPMDRTRQKVKQKRNPYDRLAAFEEALEAVLVKYDIKGCMLEGYGFNQGRQKQSALSIVSQVRYGESVRAVLYGLGIDWYEVSPTQLKQYALGKGQGGKDEIRLGVYKSWGFEAKTDDECDAYVLARMIYDWVGGGKSTKYRQGVLDKVVNSEHNLSLRSTVPFD